jgi:hypothetical protein
LCHLQVCFFCHVTERCARKTDTRQHFFYMYMKFIVW